MPDIAVTNSVGDTVSVFLGNGDGTFAAAPGSPFGSGGGSPRFVAVGTFNAGTVDDLAVVNQSGTVAVFLGNGNGTFAAAPGSPFGSGGAAVTVAVGNFNVDAITDLVVVNIGTNNLAVFLGNGDGSFTAAPGSPFSSGGLQPRRVVVGNFNADTVLDLAVQNFDSNNVAIFLGNGDGSFAVAPGSPFGSGGNTPNSMAVGNFNTDTVLDLAVSNSGSNNVAVFLGNGDGTFTPVAPFGSGGSNPVSVTAGNFNADAVSDLAVTNFNSNTVAVFLGNGDGTFTAAPGSPFGSGGSNTRLTAVGDLDGDSTPDLAVVNESGNIHVLLNTSGTTTALATSGSPTTFGESVTFTATVTPTLSGQPVVNSGFVSFFDGAGLLATVPVSTGVAVFSTSTLGGGSHNITASFADPSAVLFTSTSPIVPQQVNPADTTTTLLSSANPIPANEVVVFTATVTADAPSIATPTGIVSFFDGAALLGTSTLSGGLATFSTSTLAQGDHDITAVLNANANFNTSTSAITVQQITFGAPLTPTGELQPDPLLPGMQMLLIHGSNGNDTISVKPFGTSTSKFVVTINNTQPTLLFAGVTGRIVIFGNAGNDTITVNAKVKKQTQLDGGADNDTITGGGGRDFIFGGTGADTVSGGARNDVLIGGGDDDNLNGGGGRDLLIGALGLDVLNGGRGDDILIGGSTSHDADLAALDAIMKEWGRTDTPKGTYGKRIAHLRDGAAGGRNGGVLLNNTTVFDDALANVLTGAGGRDWFFDGTADVVNASNRFGPEVVTPVP